MNIGLSKEIKEEEYRVANMPGAVSLSSTYALTSVTNRYGLLIADHGLEKALARSKPIVEGLNAYRGRLTNLAVGKAHDLPAERWHSDHHR